VQRLAGEVISWQYDNKTRDFSLNYYPSNGTTIIYANRQDNYPNGIAVNILPRDAVSITEPEPNYFHVVSTTNDKTRVMVSFVRL
jgi:hypothetical protein